MTVNGPRKRECQPRQQTNFDSFLFILLTLSEKNTNDHHFRDDARRSQFPQINNLQLLSRKQLNFYKFCNSKVTQLKSRSRNLFDRVDITLT